MPASTTPSTPSARAGRRTLAVTATALALVLGLGACGSSDGEKAEGKPKADRPVTTVEVDEPTAPEPPAADEPTGGEDPTDEPGEPTTPSSPADAPSEDEAEIQDRLEQINLTIDDLPDGWSTTAPDPSDDDDGVIEQCTSNGGPDDVPVKVRADSFSRSDDETGGWFNIDSATVWMADGGVADDLMDEVKTDEFAACATEILLEASDPSTTIEGRFVPVESDVPLGDDVAVLQGTFTAREDGKDLRVAVMVFQIRTGQVISSLTAVAANAPGDPALLTDLVELLSERQATSA